jgi:hypothetical protein
MKYLIALLEKLNLPFAIDKQLHFIVGFIISAIVILITQSIVAGLFFTIFFAYVKEFRDEVVYGGFDWKDILATFMGGLTFSIIYLWL